MKRFKICDYRKETVRAVFFICLSQLLVIAPDSAHSATKQHSRRHSLMLNNYDDDNHQSASAATRSLVSVGQVDDKDGHPQQADDWRERRERQRNMTSHQAVSASQATKRLNSRHQALFQQHLQQYHQRLIPTQQQPQQLPHRSILGQMRKQRDVASSSLSFCSLLPQNPDLPRLLRTLSQKGDTHLIEYSIEFPEYPTNPLRADGITNISRPNANPSYVYEEAKWQRVFSSQGKVLLTLGFNYDALSLGLLTYGVQKMTVPVLDNPPKCFAAQNASQRIALTLDMLLRDFDEDGGSGSDVGSDEPLDTENILWKQANNFVCHQIIQDRDGFAKFSHECCTIRRRHFRERRIECVISSADKLVSLINILLTSLAVLFFFFGPLLLQKLLFSGSTGRPEYVVPIEPHLWKTILIRRVPCEDGSSPAKRKEMRQFVRFRELVKSLKSEQVMRVVFRRLDILVDNRELMSEEEVPVGLLRFLLDAFVRCRITRVEPFRTCCAESVMGSWSPFFLWFRLKRHASDCNRGCKEICAWTSIFRCLGGLLLMVILLLPCYVRLAAFYWFEKEETDARNEARSRLGLRYRPGELDLFQWLTPGHSLVVSIHVAFYVSYLLLFIMRAANASRVDDVIIRCVTDMRKLRRKECLRMLCAHLVLPFEKFGLCGVLVAALYWPLALPFCLLVTLTYCIPTLYLVGRLLVPSRPKCLGRRPLPSPITELDSTNSSRPLLSEGTTSFSSCLLLDRISVDHSPSAKGNIASPTTEHHPRPSSSPARASVAIAIASTLVALCLLVCMLALLAMYSETCVFLVKAVFFATLGAIVNATHSICNVILVFWACVYVIVPYRAVYARYAELSRCIFRFLKASLGERIESTSQLRHEKQKNTAFRFLDARPAAANRSSTDFHLNARQPKTAGSSREQETSVKTTEADKDSTRTPADRTETVATDETIEYRDDRLHWKVRSLVMFVDRKDKPRIPRDLFLRICELNVTESPGPVRRAMVIATGQVVASLFFLLLLYVVVRVSAEMQASSGVLQAIIVFSVGSAPVVAFIFIRGRSKHWLNEYSLTGNIRKTILEHYEHAWPVQDLRFSHLKDSEETKDGEPLLEESCPHEIRCQRSTVRGRASYDPSQVDLLITIREEDEPSEPRQDESCLRSPASSGSPNSDVFSAEDFTREGLPLRLLGNRVVRCISDPTAESHHPNARVAGFSCHDIAGQREGPADRKGAL